MKIIFYLLLLCPVFCIAQNTGIGTNTPNTSALLDLTSTNKGLLIPRMTTQARLNNIALPAKGLMVYDSTKKAIFFYDGTSWQSMQSTGTTKSIYVPAGGFGYYSSPAITRVALGLRMAKDAPAAHFIIPKPVDWDSTTPFTISLQFSLPALPNPLNLIRWRLFAESVIINKPNTGWDSYGFHATEDAPILILTQTDPGYTELAQQQTWTPKYSNIYHTFYFGTSVTTDNDFSEGLLWQFGFQRGYTVNSESYDNYITVTGATITYTSK